MLGTVDQEKGLGFSLREWGNSWRRLTTHTYCDLISFISTCLKCMKFLFILGRRCMCIMHIDAFYPLDGLRGGCCVGNRIEVDKDKRSKAIHEVTVIILLGIMMD